MKANSPRYYTAIVLLIVLLTGAAACGRAPVKSTPVLTPPAATTPRVDATPFVTPVSTIASVTPVTPPAPATTTTPAPVPEPTLTVMPAPSPAATQTVTPTVAATQPPPAATTPRGPAEVDLSVNRAAIDFPDSLAFIVEGKSGLPVRNLVLEYGTDRRSVVNETSRVEPERGAGALIKTSWKWEMRKSGSVPPGARVWWQWRITDEEGRVYVTPRQTVVWEDSRYQWTVEPAAGVDIYWQGQDPGLRSELTAGLASRLLRVKLEVDIPKERKPKILVYATSEEIRSAVLFTQEWTGALAFPSYNIILTAVNASNLEWAKGALAHEITHLLVGEAVFGPFGDIPTWLNEGLARYSEGEMTDFDRGALAAARKEGRLISLRSLAGGFPADSSQALLAYAQSGSLVQYLVDVFGWPRLRELLAVFKDGSTYDSALKKVFGFDVSGLEVQWKSYLDTSLQ